MKKILYYMLLLVLFTACSKDEVDMPPTAQPADVVPRFEVIEIETNFGNMYIWLHTNTPLHRANFLKLANSGFYNNTTFHRIIPDFMIQGGDPNSKDDDPTNDGQGGPGYTIPAEILDTFRNDRGTLAAARLGNNVNPQRESSGSQFYINLINNNHLNREYTVFGKVINGLQVADSIVLQPRGSTNRPIDDIKMKINVLKLTKDEIFQFYNFEVPI
jgi:cyclophilin family peptidyl-prolyl cis-trans isomerase